MFISIEPELNSSVYVQVITSDKRLLTLVRCATPHTVEVVGS